MFMKKYSFQSTVININEEEDESDWQSVMAKCLGARHLAMLPQIPDITMSDAGEPSGIFSSMEDLEIGRDMASICHPANSPILPKTIIERVPRSPSPMASPQSTPMASPQSTPMASPQSSPMASPQSTPRTSPQPLPRASPRPSPRVSLQSLPRASPRPSPRVSLQSLPRASPRSSPRVSLQSLPRASPRSSPRVIPQSTPMAAPQPPSLSTPRPPPRDSPQPPPRASPRPTARASRQPAPMASPQPSPRASPQPSPRASPQPSPSASPQPSPSASPQPSPSASPQPSPRASPRADVRPKRFLKGKRVERWRGQHPIYKPLENGCFEVLGLTHAKTPDLKKRKLTKGKKVRQVAKKTTNCNLSESFIGRSVSTRSKNADLIKSFENLQWKKSKGSDSIELASLFRDKTNGLASGFFRMNGVCEKPSQKTANYKTIYTLLKGSVAFKIADEPYMVLQEFESVTIPELTGYAVKNLSDDESVLYFNVYQH